MNGREHYREAERLLTLCDGKTRDAVNVILSQASIHAALALAAATYDYDWDHAKEVTR